MTKILLVDDEPLLLESLEIILSLSGDYEVIGKAGNGVEALELLSKDIPDLMLVDLRNLGLTGKEAEKMLDEVYITANKNTIPNDPESPFVTSGIRLGTPAATTRGMNTEDMAKIANIIAMTLKDFEASKEKAAAMVKELTDKYPLYK